MTPANDNRLTGASIRFPVEPRLVPRSKIARRLHLTAREFDAVEPRMRSSGFPAPCPFTGHYDLRAADLWLDRQAGLAPSPPPAANDDDEISRRLDGWAP